MKKNFFITYVKVSYWYSDDIEGFSQYCKYIGNWYSIEEKPWISSRYLCRWIYWCLLGPDHFRKVHMTMWPHVSCLVSCSSPPPPPTALTAAPIPSQNFCLEFTIFMFYIQKWNFFSWLCCSLCEYLRLTWIWLICSSLLRGWVPLNMWKDSRTHRMCVFRLYLSNNPKIGTFRGDTGSGLL